MATIEMYIDPYCPYCAKAKRLLTAKGQTWAEIDVIADPKRRAEMRDRASGRNTVPQIFIDGQHIGGCDDLHALDAKGGLDPLLAA
ncbi:glutaredoxin 3 [Elstera cyanobacteriorum]|uniref:Glutaredoxin n=1 Tax=Elstera cyanobacteriorum TaxID=2022747 RepID=A0A255XJ31_9PROT|nr:glutaredoxin 3 [Elstera cyanobacteriorum]OYQ16938.1 glutaredoxin 3 [Elstera cyanobacteriorum]GFZ89605.1 glutaredoxin 3 [Elstera cyanobacteriorum]